MICLCAYLARCVKDNIDRMFFTHGTIFPSGSVTRGVVMSCKKLRSKPKLPKVSTYMVVRFRT